MTAAAQAYPRALLRLALVWTVLLGIALALVSGFATDDPFERHTFDVNVRAVAGFFSGVDTDFLALRMYADRYYGIGFHVVAYPFSAAAAPLYAYLHGLAPYDARTLATHLPTMLLFFVGAFALWRMLLLGGATRGYAALGTLLYISNPYLLGHAAINVKDIPFLSLWLICTWQLLRMADALIVRHELRLRDFLWLALGTAALLSIRISGLMIMVQYGIALGLLAISQPSTLRANASRLIGGLALFAVGTALITWLAYPIFWLDPRRIFEAIRYMSHHPWGGCTMTWGSCMPGQNLPAGYLPAWMLVKLPLLVLAGAVAAPLLALRRDTHGTRRFALQLSCASAIVLASILIATKANLYNELRQVLFIVGLCYLAALLVWSRMPRIAVPLLAISCGIAAIDHARLYPYAYVWFNEAARFWPIDRYYATDYWFMSSREIALDLRASPEEHTPCMAVWYPFQYQPYLTQSPRCLVDTRKTDLLMPLLAHSTTRSRLGPPGPAHCREAAAIERRLALSPYPMQLSELYYCDSLP